MEYKPKVPHTNFTLELQYLLMDVIVINNSYHIYSKVSVGVCYNLKGEILRNLLMVSGRTFNK